MKMPDQSLTVIEVSSKRNYKETVKMAKERNQGGNRGFAAMDDEKQREIARKGGEAVSRDREHMAEIGRKGGEASHGNRGSRNVQNQSGSINRQGTSSRGSSNNMNSS